MLILLGGFVKVLNSGLVNFCLSGLIEVTVVLITGLVSFRYASLGFHRSTEFRV